MFRLGGVLGSCIILLDTKLKIMEVFSRSLQTTHKSKVYHTKKQYNGSLRLTVDWVNDWLIIDRCTGRWTSYGTSPWTTLPPTWCSSQTCTVLIDYWLLIIDRCIGRWTSCGLDLPPTWYWLIIDYWPVNILRNLALDNSPTDMVFLTDVYCIDWLLIDYW